MKKKIVAMTFELTDKQVKKIKKFHPKCKKKYTGAIGGGDYYKFYPTGIGVLASYICKCGEELNLTNVSEL